MTKKLEAIGAKTGLARQDVRRLCGFGVLSMAGALLALLCAGCCGNRNVPAGNNAGPDDPREPVLTRDSREQPDPRQAGPGPAGEPARRTDRSPWEGYPAGTRYATVSPKDF
ncbi:MAG: hypothetical protein PHW69_02840 [Elusimicrobiaceae bacterium]|nr:hypothetical protein [Elusimicrobiaceae bacterium]